MLGYEVNIDKVDHLIKNGDSINIETLLEYNYLEMTLGK